MIRKAIILVAGMGTRLKPLTLSNHKCLTKVNGTPILFNALENLRRAGVDETLLVVGSVVGYDGITLAQVLEPRLTTVHQDTRTIGRRAAEELISLVENPRTTFAEKILVPGELVQGASVKKII